jgi:hypothetical protein
VVSLLAAGAVFVGVLLSTPPGFISLPELILGPARGARGAAEAYALGAAATLALATLLLSAGVLSLAANLVGRKRRG